MSSCRHHNHFIPTKAGIHRHYSDLSPIEKLEAFAVDESTPLTAHAVHQVAHDIHEFNLLKERSGYFLIYILAIVLFMGLNGALFLANLPKQDFIEANYEWMFHILSFWGVFLFTLVEATLLVSTGVASLGAGDAPKKSNEYYSIIILVDVLFSFVSALLYTLDPEYFEVPSHYLEYSVQIPISCVNLIFFEDQTQVYQRTGNRSYQRLEQGAIESNTADPELEETQGKTPPTGFPTMTWADVSSLAPLGLSLLQLLLYSDIISTKMSGERAAHFCEFLNEILNGSFALRYAIRNYSQTQHQLNQHHV